MSADNEIAILHLPNSEYRVADNVSMSYNTLEPNIDHSDKKQLEMVYNIWKDAPVYYGKGEALAAGTELLMKDYYEYGMSSFFIEIDWEEITKEQNNG